jgi:tetratricopeptide (TPR) repeat protein
MINMSTHHFKHGFFCDGKRLFRVGVTIFIWCALCLSTAAWAEDVLDSWRKELSTTRILAENNAPNAYQEAKRLQSILPADATPVDQARLLNVLARVEVYLALTDQAEIHAQQAYDLAKKHADKVGQVEANLNVALNAVYQAKLNMMEAAVKDSMEIVEGINRPDLLAESMLRAAMMYHRQGQFDDSVTMTMQTMEVAKGSNDAVALTLAHQGVALSYDQSGNMQEAQDHYLQMLKYASAANMRRLEADALIGLGRTYNRLGDMPRGEQYTRNAVELYREIGNPFSLSFGLFALAESLHQQGRTAVSLSILNEAVAIYDQHPNKIGLWWTLYVRSTYHQILGHDDMASADAKRGYALAKSIGYPIYLNDSAKRLAAIVAGKGDHQRAYELLAEASTILEHAAQKPS